MKQQVIRLTSLSWQWFSALLAFDQRPLRVCWEVAENWLRPHPSPHPRARPDGATSWRSIPWASIAPSRAVTAISPPSLQRRLGLAVALASFPLLAVAVVPAPWLGAIPRAAVGLATWLLALVLIQGLAARAWRPSQQGDALRLQELEQAVEQERAFVNAVSHELRSPLTLVAGYSRRLLRRSTNLDEKQRQALEVIDQEIARLGRLLNDLLDLSRGDAGRLQMRREPVHLERLFAQLFELWHGDPVGSRLQFPDPSTLQACWAIGDPDRLKQVLINLVENAIKYTPAGSAIQLSVLQQRDWLQIRVRDFGPGIPLAEQELIFERFRRGSTTAGQGGSGLGLSVVRMLMQQMGGQVALIPAEASDPSGTTMGLRLPNAGTPPFPFPLSLPRQLG